MNKKVSDIIIHTDASLIDALKQMDRVNRKLLLVFEDDRFVNVLSIGDLQRGILKKISLDSKISTVLRKNTRIAKDTESLTSVKDTMEKYRIECMPVISENSVLIDALFWEDIFDKEKKRQSSSINLPVIIMAGGKGSRMKPITNVIPKPLIPIGERTIIEEIMNRFVNHECHEFYLSVNYKAEMIKHYFSQLKNENYIVNYFQENKPLGTAGSLFLIRDMIKTTFFVSNCDIIIEEDYAELIKYHRESKNELTIISALKHYPIPYGTIKTEAGGVLIELIEKPELTFQINTGMYILEPHLLDEIPENEFFHITDLIEKIKKRSGRVGVFPISEGSWTDIGNWEEYLKLVKQ